MTALTLSVRPVTQADCRLLWEWANDPAVRAASFNQATIPWADHVAWFDEQLRSSRCFMYIVEAGAAVPMGQVRFSIGEDSIAEVGVSIAAEWRGRGLAARALRLACDAFLAEGGGPIVARIRPENHISMRTFEKAGFRQTGFDGKPNAVHMEHERNPA